MTKTDVPTQGPLGTSAARGRVVAALGKVTGPLAAGAVRLVDGPMKAIQRLIGAERMPYVFLAPNFLFFGLFVFAPIVINVVFSVTGGTALFPSQRPFVAAGQYAYLFDCESFLDPNSCREDHFWRGVANTGKFVVFQVTAMVLLSLLTAVILNMKIRARGFSAPSISSLFFFPRSS